MATRYEIVSIHEASPPLGGHSLTVARVMDVELGSELFSRKTIDGVIRIIADASGFGKYVNIDKVFQELIDSGFLVRVTEE